GRYVVAQDNGPGNFEVLDRFPERTPITFQAVFDGNQPFLARYAPLRLSVDDRLSPTRSFDVHDTDGGHRVVAYARLDDGRQYEQLLDATSAAGSRRSVEWRLSATDEPGVADVPLNDSGWLELGVRFDSVDPAVPGGDHKIVYGYRVREG